MRQHFLKRTGRAAAVAIACALVPWGAGHSQDESSEGGENKLHFPTSDDAAGLIEAAARSVRAGEAERGIDLLRTVVDRDHDSRRPNQLVPLLEAGAKPKGPRRFAGVTEKATAVLRTFPKEARAIYRTKYDRRAQAAFETALQADDPVREILRVYQRYPLATMAAPMLEKAADRALARGDLERARRLYERLLRDHREELKSPPAIRERLLIACVGLGRKADVERTLASIAAEDKNAKVHLNGLAKSREEIVGLTLKHDALIRGDAAETKPSLTMPRGDAANRAAFARPIRLGAPRFRARSFEDSIEFSDRSFRRFDRGFDPGPARFLPLFWNDSIFVATADKLRAFALDGTERPRITPLGIPYSDDNSNAQFGAAIERGVLVAPFVVKVQDDQSFRGIPIRVRIPLRKLAGFDLERWRWKWNHRDLLAGNAGLEHASFPVAPVCEAGECFVAAFAIQGFVHCYAVAFDAETGAVRWNTWIASGQVEQTMFGEHAREPLAAPVAVADGQVINVTQMGCVAAIDADTGRIRWVTEYDQIEVRSAKGYYPDPRNIGWENNAPVVETVDVRGADGKPTPRTVVIAAPMDSDYYYGIDAANGDVLWQYQRAGTFEPNVELRYLLGASDGRVVLAGGKRIVCRDVVTGRLAWKVDLTGRLVTGRGLIAAGKVYIPTTESIEAISLDKGTVESTPQTLPVTGNLAVVGDTIVVVSEGQVAAFHNQRTDKAPARGRDF